MCNPYRMTKAATEVANLFRGVVGSVRNFASEVYPGYPGLVMVGGELRSMVWGFPLVLKGKNGQPLKPKPINNARVNGSNSSSNWRRKRGGYVSDRQNHAAEGMGS